METKEKKMTELAYEMDSCVQQKGSQQISDPECPREPISVTELLNECYGGWVES